MDQRIFDQLDMLERGARYETRPPRDAYHDSSVVFSAYDDPQAHYEEVYGGDIGYHGGIEQDEYQEQPLTLDSFDGQFLRQPGHDNRHSQALVGRARLPPSGPAYSGQPPQMPQMHRDPAPRSFDLSQFALDEGLHGQSSSSAFEQPMPSSPAFSASQRRPALAEYGRQRIPSFRGEFAEEMEHQPGYEPFSVEQLEAEEQSQPTVRQDLTQRGRPSYNSPDALTQPRQRRPVGPVVQGINLVSTHELPDRLRAIFPYPLFNAVQSKPFDTIYNTNNNFVLAAPTGSGKTAVLELAICRLLSKFANDSYKIVYQAPTKSLCAERQRDWEAKFTPLGLNCAELTGDTDNAYLRNVQQASIIITTPEKWDSITRKWKDHQKLMQMVKLFLIDEVHILKEDRGATLEAVVSRMKSVGSNVRFIALSATVPNLEDLATWLGQDPMNPHIPASRERFGEEFRPVQLKKHVCGYQSGGNDFAFEKMLNGKLPEVISKWTQRKPIMVFCFTRNACVETAKLLANWWATKGPREKYWTSPRNRIVVGDKDLRETVSSGVAFHHAGLSIQDRNAVEKGYLEGEINVICCTSTLAVGVNLPCHLVIIKNTVTYQAGAANGCKEYSDLEVMQMLGRAGRPQFDDNAVAVIMTRSHRVPYYEKMISGHEILESCLHLNLIDHLNAEIGLGTVKCTSSAKKWLSGTFLYVRLKDNPEHYKIEGDAPGRSLDDRLENICSKGIAALEAHDLVTSSPKVRCTEFGDAMARYYMQFDTMKIFMALPPKSKVSEILSAISQAAEFRDIRFRAGEKPTYKDLNKNSSIKFPIPVNLDASAHKVSLIIQSVLGAVELSTEDYKQRIEFSSAKSIIFQHVTRLIRCIVDCQLYLDDSVTVRNALMLARSLGAQVWDDSPLNMKQLEGVGTVTVRKLVHAGIKSIDDLENSEAHKIEQILSRNPPFGTQLQQKAKAFPKLRVALKMMGEPFIKKDENVTIKIKAEIGFLNDKVPEQFQRKPVYVCLLAETSDGLKVHFARISAKKLNQGQDVLFSANLTSASQTVRAYVMCDEIAGTMRHAMLKPEIPSLAFPPPKAVEDANAKKQMSDRSKNTSKRRASAARANDTNDIDSDEFNDGDLDDADFARAEADGFVDIDELEHGRGEPKQKKRKTSTKATTNEDWEPQQLANGKWACNHRCGDKNACKHLCCREGVDKKPKPPKAKENRKQTESESDLKQTQLNMTVAKKSNASAEDAASLDRSTGRTQPKTNDFKEARDLNRLHNSVKTKTRDVPSLADTSGGKKNRGRLSFLDAAREGSDEDDTSNYDIENWGSSDLPDLSDLIDPRTAPRVSPTPPQQSDSQALDNMDTENDVTASTKSSLPDEGKRDCDPDFSFIQDHNFGQDDDWMMNDIMDEELGKQTPTTPLNSKSDKRGDQGKHLFVGYSTDSAAGQDMSAAAAPGFVLPAEKTPPETETNAQQLPPVTQAPDREEEDEVEKWFKEHFGEKDFNFIR